MRGEPSRALEALVAVPSRVRPPTSPDVLGRRASHGHCGAFLCSRRGAADGIPAIPPAITPEYVRRRLRSPAAERLPEGFRTAGISTEPATPDILEYRHHRLPPTDH